MNGTLLSVGLTPEQVRAIALKYSSRTQSVSVAPVQKIQPSFKAEIYDWSGVDWSQSNRKIAAKLGCNNSTVQHARVRYGKPSPNLKFRPSKVKWDGVDWSLTDKAISERVNCHETTVCRWRKKLGLPSSTGRRGRKAAFDWSVVDWSWQTKDIAAQLGCHSSAVRYARKRHAGKGKV